MQVKSGAVVFRCYSTPKKILSRAKSGKWKIILILFECCQIGWFNLSRWICYVPCLENNCYFRSVSPLPPSLALFFSVMTILASIVYNGKLFQLKWPQIHSLIWQNDGAIEVVNVDIYSLKFAPDVKWHGIRNIEPWEVSQFSEKDLHNSHWTELKNLHNSSTEQEKIEKIV